jgi:opacity protein-like surface antigen
MSIKSSLWILVGLLAAAPLFAASHQSGAYVGVDGGWSIPSSAPSSISYSTDNQNFTAGGTLGYQMAVGQKMAAGVEANYTHFGETSYSGNAVNANHSGSFKNSAIQILLTGTYLMDNGFNTFVKVGAAHEQSSFNLASSTTGVATWIPAVAAGLGYELVKNFNLYAQYERTFGDNWENANTGTGGTPDSPVSLNVLTMGVNYTLPM